MAGIAGNFFGMIKQFWRSEDLDTPTLAPL